MYHNIIEELDLVILFCFVKLGMGLKWLPEQVTKKISFSKTKKNGLRRDTRLHCLRWHPSD